jgi:ankyrin repeat protein
MEVIMNTSILPFILQLSGNFDICQQLLQCGCKPDVVNSVGRTAAQMAAFVGRLVNYNVCTNHIQN